MPKGTNQKLKLYYLSRIMLEKTDDWHALTMHQIQEELLKYGVTADRKSLYDDMEALRILGIDVIGEKEGKGYTYHVGKKHFDIAELKLLVDAIQSSKFITEKKSNEESNIPFVRNGGLHTLPGLISLSFPGADGEAILHRMDLLGICISTGSACNSRDTDISHVLKAIDLDERYVKGTIRVSLGKYNTSDDVEKIIRGLEKILG